MSYATQPKRSSQAERVLVLIEDNPADAMVAEVVHQDTSHCTWLKIFHMPDEALAYLQQADRPVVIITDLMLPGRTGLDLVPEIRRIPGLETVPVVVLTGSDNPADIARAYGAGANCVVKKPSSWDKYRSVLEKSFEFWCTVVALPKAS